MQEENVYLMLEMAWLKVSVDSPAGGKAVVDCVTPTSGEEMVPAIVIATHVYPRMLNVLYPIFL